MAYNGFEELTAAILRYAYTDMLDAMLADAGHRFRKYSYNCHVYYEWLRTGRGKYGASDDGWDKAKHDAEKLIRWFCESDRCKSLCKKVEGKWFVEQVKKHVKAFALDQTPEWMIRPAYTLLDSSTDRKNAENKLTIWRTKRDEWREQNGLSKVEDE